MPRRQPIARLIMRRALRQADFSNVPIYQRDELRDEILAEADEYLTESFHGYCQAKSLQVALGENGDTPIIDWWRYLVENGKIKEFLEYLINEFLPKLFDLIMMLIDAFSEEDV